jgi:helix-turn-helix protein
MAERELVDVYEGARATGLAPTTLYKLARQRRIRSFKVLTTLRFDRSDLLALVKERPRSSTDGSHFTVAPQFNDNQGQTSAAALPPEGWSASEKRPK